jgi:hypothetical protein
MALVSLADLRQQARNRSDMRIGGIWTDADFNAAINQSVFELNDLLVKADVYFLTSSISTLQTDTTLYPLPSDYYKLMGVDWQASSTSPWFTLSSYQFAERNKLANASATSGPSSTNLRYCQYGSNVSLLPAPSTGQQVQFWYVPVPTRLVNDTDTYNFLGGFEEFVIVNTAIKALAAEESDTSIFMAQKAEMKDRIEQMAPKRDQGEPHSVVETGRCDDWWY